MGPDNDVVGRNAPMLYWALREGRVPWPDGHEGRSEPGYVRWNAPFTEHMLYSQGRIEESTYPEGGPEGPGQPPLGRVRHVPVDVGDCGLMETMLHVARLAELEQSGTAVDHAVVPGITEFGDHEI